MGAVVSAVGMFLTVVGNAIFGTQKKTVSDIQVMELLTPDVQDRDARRKAYRGAIGSTKEYVTAYGTFRRQYKKTFRDSTFRSLGYLPTSTAVTRTILPSLVSSYLQGLYGYTTVVIDFARDTYLGNEHKCGYGRQQLAGYDFATGKLVESEKTYSFINCTSTSETGLQYTLVREFEETILDNLTDSYGYDGTYVYQGGEKYLVGEISGTVSGGNYTTVCVHEPKEVVTSVISASSTGNINATVVYLDDTNGDGIVEVSEITNNTLNLRFDLGVGASVGDTVSINIDGAVSSVTVTQDMIDNGYLFSTTDYLTGFQQQLPDLVILTPMETITKSYSNALFDDEVTYVGYRVTSGEVPNTVRYFIAPANTLNIYIMTTVNVSPILTVKKDFAIVNPQKKKLAQAMKRFGLGGANFEATLSQDEIHSAYIFMGIDPSVNNPHHNLVVFRMFDLMAAGSGNVVIRIENLNMRYEFNIQKSLHAGVVGPVGTYTKTLVPYSIPGTDSEGNPTSTSDTRMTMRYQGSSNQYREIVVTNFLQTYKVVQSNSALLDDPDGECRLIIPIDLLNGLRYNDWVNVYERSLCMVVYAQQTVVLDWYQQDWFKIVLQIVSIVLMVIPFFQGAGAALQVAIRLMAVYLIMRVAMWVAEQVGGDLGVVLAAIVAIVATYYLGPMTGGEAVGWLPLASQGLSIGLQLYQHKMDLELQEAQKDHDAYVKAKQEEIHDLNDKIAEYEAKGDAYRYAEQVFKEFDMIGQSNPMFQTIEGYVGSIVNTEWLVDGSWMYDVDRQIAIRQQPYVGV